MKRALLILLLTPLLLAQSYNVPFNPPAVAVGCNNYDDFSTDTIGTCWTLEKGSFTVDSGLLKGGAQTPDSSTFIAHDTSVAANQWVVAKFVTADAAGRLAGIMLRHDGSGNAYVLRYQDGSGIQWRSASSYCNVLTAIAAQSWTLTAGDYIGVAVNGSGNNVVLYFWDFGASLPQSASTIDEVSCVTDTNPCDDASTGWGAAGWTSITDPSPLVDGAGTSGFCAPGHATGENFDDFAIGAI